MLDFDGHPAQEVIRVLSNPQNFYAAWRNSAGSARTLHDAGDQPSERLMQSVWLHQRIQRDRLETADGRPVRVIHPGFVSLEGGPDFCNAILQIGGSTPCTGDIEVDRVSAGWRAHGHDRNKHFQNVILHVVWDEANASAKQDLPPVVSLKNVLDAPLAELSLSLESEPLRTLPENLRGKCCAPLRDLNETELTQLLQQAALERLEGKAAQIRARARNSGWEQALWEHLFRALGYKRNPWPMQSLAETKPNWPGGADSALTFQARLLGVSGLLPGDLTHKQRSTDNYLRRIWDSWWRERDEFEPWLLPRAAWKFHGLRPTNHPQRRLALAAHWLADKHFISKIESWSAAQSSDKQLPDTLFDIFHVERDEFWSWHWTFKSARLKKPLPLLGAARVTDLAVNVVLPWLWIRAVEGGNEKIRREVERRFFAWPAAEDNSVLKLARQRLLGSSTARSLKKAAAQQGLIQIVRDFCEHSNAVCEHCRFPELVRGWKDRETI